MGEPSLRGVDLAGARAGGMDSDALRRAFGLLETWIDEGVLPGAAALVTRGGKVAGEAYLGLARRANATSVTSDTIFSLASVTKPFTAAAVMLLVQRGVVALDEPLFRLLPGVLAVADDRFDRLSVTLRHVLAHCSGLPRGFSPDNIALRQAHRPFTDFVRSFGRQALFFAPGSAHLYSNPGIILAAEVVGRAASGTLGVAVETPRVGHYHGFVHEEILAPLGMSASSLLPPADWDERIARVEDTGQEGHDWEVGNSAYFRSLGIPWGGMYSRPRDLIRFVDLFLPSAAGRRRVGGGPSSAHVLSPATVAAMTTVQFAPPDAPADLAPDLRDIVPEGPLALSVAWGIGWAIKAEQHPWQSGDLTSPAAYGHWGATGTAVWADPANDVACVLLTNRAFRSGWGRDRPRRTLFANAVLGAVR